MKRSAPNNDDERRLIPQGMRGGKKGDDSSSTSSEDKKPKATPTGKQVGSSPFRKCKNFAERLMRVLQNGIGTDTIWWIGQGKAIAVHTRNLKHANMLSEHLKVKDYSVFIRNCNRWGFRRTVQFPVPQGVICYQCSLFQRDEPHLVHHMRMDSDVQDVFVKHRDSDDGNAPFNPKRMAKAARAAAGKNNPRFAPLNQVPPPPPGSFSNPAAPPQQVGAQGMNALQGFTTEQVQQLIQGTNLSALSNAVTGKDPPGAAASHGRATTNSPPVVTLSSAPSLEALLVQQLVGGTGTSTAAAAHQVQPSPVAPQQQEAPHDLLLQRILRLGEEYLDKPNNHGSSANAEPITMALQILKIQGKKYNAEKEEEKRLAQTDPLTALGLQLMASKSNNATSTAATTSNTSMADRVLQAEQLFQSVNLAVLASPPPPPPASQMASVPVATTVTSPDPIARQQHQWQQQQHQVDDPAPSEALMQLLATNGVAPANPLPMQQQQQQPPTLQEQAEMAAPATASANLAKFLDMLQNPPSKSR